MTQERQNTFSEQQRSILASIDALRSEIKIWGQTYLIKAPINGQVALSKVWSEKQFGQTVNIQLDGFPYQEYGVVKGKVAHISLVPTSSGGESSHAYVVEMAVPSDLRTTYGKKLPFRQSMVGTANVVTENRRILV